METSQYFADLEARFLALPKPYFDLHAIHSEPPIEEAVRLVGIAIALTPEDEADGRPPELQAKQLAQRGMRYAAAALDYPEGVWHVSGGPDDDSRRDVLQRRWRALAVEAAVAANVAPVGSSEDAAVHAWLNLLKSNGIGRDWLIENLPEASALLCAEFRAKALLRGDPRAGQATKGDVGKSQFPRRATWLREQMDARGLTSYGLEKLGGPDDATTKKILACAPVNRSVLLKLASALSGGGHKITLADIPND